MIKFLNFLSNKLNFFKLLLSDKRIIKFVLNPFKLEDASIFSIGGNTPLMRISLDSADFC